MYSLALSHTGGAPIMPQVNLFKQTPHPIPAPPDRTPRLHPGPARPSYHRARLFAFSDQEPCLISQESHIDGVRQLSPDREKELGVRPCSASPSPPPRPPPSLPDPPLYTCINYQKEERCRSQGRVCRLVFDWRRNKRLPLVCFLCIFYEHPTQAVTVLLICVFISVFFCLFFFKRLRPFFFLWVPIKLSFSSISKLE